MKKQTIIDQVDKFLEKRIKSDYGGWAPVDDVDVHWLDSIIDSIIKYKWEEGEPGLPLEFSLVNRTKFESNQFFNIPYRDDKDIDIESDTLGNAMINLSMAMDRVKTEFNVLKNRKRVKNGI